MIERNALARTRAQEPMMSIEEFAAYGLEPGQRGLLWDFEQKRYVVVSKPPQLRVALGRAMAAAAVTAVHGAAAISLIGGLPT